MRAAWNIMAVSSICLMLSGCALASRQYEKDKAKIEAIKQQISTNHIDQLNKGRDMVYAAEFMLLQETNRTPTVDWSQKLLGRAMLTLGPPDYQDAMTLQKMVYNLRATNIQLQQQGLIQLKKYDARVAELQGKLDTLEKKEQAQEAKNDAHAKEAAALASKWQRLMRVFWWAFYIIAGLIIGCIALRVLSMIPATALVAAPVSQVYDAVIGSAGRGLFHLFPKAMDSAGVVAKNTYQTSEAALNQMIKVIQSARKDHNLETVLDPLLKDATDKNGTRRYIDARKYELGLK